MKTKLLSVIMLVFTGISLNSYSQWSAPVNLSPMAQSAGTNESMGSCIDVNGDTVHVIWTDKHTATHSAVYYTRSVDAGLTWSTPVNITDTSGNAWNPAIAVSGPNVHVVWREINPLNNHRASWYKHSLDGGITWGTNVYIDSTADWPAVTVSGNNVYIANDSVTSMIPYNTEIFLLRSTDNGFTWQPHQQISFAVNRSEDEAIHAEGAHVHMSWNDKRTGKFQILYKESSDYGLTWGPDMVVDTASDYNTMVWSDGNNIDVIAAGAPSGHYQVLLAQSANTGATWATITGTDISNDTAHTYFLPDMVRNGNDLHVVSSSSNGAKYLHSADGGASWDAPYTFTGTSTFVAYSGCTVHIIYVSASHRIFYMRNPTANAGHCSAAVGVNEQTTGNELTISPNPSWGQFQVLSSKLKVESIKVVNILGETVYQSFIPNQQLTLNLSGYSKGLYFVQLKTENGIVNKKIIIE